MGNKVLYAIIYIWAKAHAFLPMPVLYLLSDISYLFIYHIAGYRRKSVHANLKNSFPEKDKKELLKLERKFYRHFADYLVETVKLAGISEKELLKRAHITNPKVIFDLKDKGHNCFILMIGHYGNWEWFSGTASRFNGIFKLNFLYRPLKNKAFDDLFLYMRTRFKSYCLKKNNIAREIIGIKRSGASNLVIFIADQTPSKTNLHYWTTFLNQDSAMLTGAERIAKKFDIPVIFCDLRQIKRGYYEIDFKLISEKPSETREFEITEKYARMMEETVLRNPALWLWTHKRWKHKKL
jgi:KDO2-lipid IV(A) lauroyltransferase